MKRFHRNSTATNDAKFSAKVRSRGICQLAGRDAVQCYGDLQCAHIVTRGIKALRWDENNALCLCHGHHDHYTRNEAAWRTVIEREYPELHEYITETRRTLIRESEAFRDSVRERLQ